MLQWRIGGISVRCVLDGDDCPSGLFNLYSRFQCAVDSCDADVTLHLTLVDQWQESVDQMQVLFCGTDDCKAERVDIRTLGATGNVDVAANGRMTGHFRLDCGSSAPLERLLRLSLAVYLEFQPDGVLLHASGVRTNDGVWLFSGPSGAGKSTIARELHGGGAFFTEDIALLRFGDQGLLEAHSTPFGKADVLPVQAASAGIAGILFVEQGKQHSLHEMSVSEVVKRLFCETRYFEKDVRAAQRALLFCERTIATGLCRKLVFAKDAGFWNLLRQHAKLEKAV